MMTLPMETTAGTGDVRTIGIVRTVRGDQASATDPLGEVYDHDAARAARGPRWAIETPGVDPLPILTIRGDPGRSGSRPTVRCRDGVATD